VERHSSITWDAVCRTDPTTNHRTVGRVASLPFAPEIVLPALDYCVHQAKLTELNPTASKRLSILRTRESRATRMLGLVMHYGLNQGPIVLMIENYRTDCCGN